MTQAICLASFAGTVTVKGAEKRRNVHKYDLNAVPIDDLVRMEEDVGFAEWKAQELRKEQARQKLAEEHRAKREQYEASLEKARQQYIVEREEGRKSERAKELERIKDFRQHLKEKRARHQQQERAQMAYARESLARREKFEATRLARLQAVYGPSRMPAAAYQDGPKYPYLAPKKPSHPIAR
jgi:hypothetical protein